MFLDRHVKSRPFKGPPREEKKEEREKAKDDPKGPEEHSLTKNRHKIPNGGQKRALLGGPKERKARKACQKAMMVFRRVVFALTSPTKVQARSFPKTKAEERIKKEKAKKEPSLNPDCQPQKHPVKMCEMGFVLVRHSAVELRRVNMDRAPKVLFVLVRSLERYVR